MQTIQVLARLRRVQRMLLVVALGLVPALGAQGLSYDLRTTGTAMDPRSGTVATRVYMAGHGQFAAGVSRIDITESMSPGGMMGVGTYTISNAAKGTTTMVNPSKREYLELKPAELAKTAAELQQSLGGMSKTDITDVKVNVEDLGGGESMEGYSTVKYRVTENYIMTMTVMGHSIRTVHHSTSDLWVAPQLDGIMNPTARPASGNATGPMAELTAQLWKAYEKVRKGVMLKRIMTSESVTDGKTRTSTMTMTVTNVKRAAISSSVFEVPSGYTEAASLGALGPLGAIGDSLTAARARSASKKAGRKPPQSL